MDKRRIVARLTDTTTGLIVEERSYDLNFWFQNNRDVLDKILHLYVDRLRSSNDFFELSFSCFKDEFREARIPF